MTSADRLRALRVVAIAMFIGCSKAPDETSAQQQRATRTQASTRVSEGRRNAITAAVEAVGSAVVTVQTTVVERTAPDPFSMFFGAQPGTRTTPGLGTGFVVRPDGVIVTNAHVIAGAQTISVMMRDGTVYPATVKGTDETIDIAVLKIDGAKNLPVVKLGDSGDLLIGEWAIAIGNPYGFLLGNSEPSVTTGVISGVGRNLVGRGEGPALYFDMIQTDASINPGNSGGPLVNADGEVIGVNSSIYSNTGGSIGLGFAIPINRVSRVVEDLLDHGSIRRPWIGVRLRQASQNTRDVIAAGATVATVTPGSPAEKAGIQPGDVIAQVRARPIRNAFEWEGAQLDLRVGDTATLTLKRGNGTTKATVRVADLPEVTAPKVEVFREIELVTLSPTIRVERGIRSPQGAMVYKVSDRVAQSIGLQAGDVIFQVNNVPVSSAEDAQRAMRLFADRGPFRIVYERNGQPFFTDVMIR